MLDKHFFKDLAPVFLQIIFSASKLLFLSILESQDEEKIEAKLFWMIRAKNILSTFFDQKTCLIYD